MKVVWAMVCAAPLAAPGVVWAQAGGVLSGENVGGRGSAGADRPAIGSGAEDRGQARAENVANQAEKPGPTVSGNRANADMIPGSGAGDPHFNFGGNASSSATIGSSGGSSGGGPGS
jgi:hypothetical protein